MDEVKLDLGNNQFIGDTGDDEIVLSPNLKDFLNIYPEFKPLINTQDLADEWDNLINKVKCLYPEFNDLDKCEDKYPFFMLVAHYAVVRGMAKSLGITAANGLVASSSVGDVSVSYQASPYATKGDELVYFLSLTPYGMEYLAWINRKSGLRIVN